MKNKKLTIVLPIMLTATLGIGAGAAFLTTLGTQTYAEWYEKNFVNSTVTATDYIKGADISSYAEIVEENTRYDGKITNYYDLTDDQQKIYQDFDGEYKNLFEILRDNGVNSLRLRVWNDPYTAPSDDTLENLPEIPREDATEFVKESYGGGHNDIDTDIWIAQQAQKFGFDDFLLNFHYSDFWADPGRQWLPKAWQKMTDDQIKVAVEEYTFESLKKFYDETEIVPKIIQLGNEITNGSFWRTYDDKSSSKTNIVRTAHFLNSAAEGVKQFESYVSTKQTKAPSIIKAIHIDGTPSNAKFLKLLNYYLIEGGNSTWVNQIGITHYQNWNGNNMKLFTLMQEIKKRFGLDSYVSEAATAYTKKETGYVGDISGSQTKDYENDFITNNQMHTKLLTSLMETASKALPNSRTGFYWWEPAWIMTGRTGWATRAGVMYAEPTDIEKQESFMTGNSWWNRGWFNLKAKTLPILKAVKSFARIRSADEEINANLLENRFYSQTFETDIIFKKAKIVNTNNTLIEAESLSNRIDTDYFVFNNEKKLRSKIIDQFNNENDGILTSQITFTNYTYDVISKKGSIDVELSDKNFYYEKSFTGKTIYFDVKPLTNTFVDINSTTQAEAFASTGTNWLNDVWLGVKISGKQTEIKEKLEQTITEEFNHDAWYDVYWDDSTGVPNYWDKMNAVTRWYRTWIALDSAGTNIINSSSQVDYDTLTKSTEWIDVLPEGEQTVLIYLTKEVDFDQFGIENWKSLKTVAIRAKLNVTYTI